MFLRMGLHEISSSEEIVYLMKANVEENPTSVLEFYKAHIQQDAATGAWWMVNSQTLALD